MKFRLATSLTAAAVLMCSLATTVRQADAAVITIDIAGTFRAGSRVVFGQSGNVSFSGSITYDTTLGSSSLVPAGTPFTISPLGQDFYGYSAAGIVATNITFGSATWTASDIAPNTLGSVSAAFFVDRDLTVEAPTAIYLWFSDEQGYFHLGSVMPAPHGAFFHQYSIVLDQALGSRSSASGNTAVIPPSPMTPVPEPASLLFVGSGLLGVVARRRMSKKR